MKNGYAQARIEPLAAGGGRGETQAATDALDAVLAVARRGWNKARTSLISGASERAENERLREAFGVFTDAAARLEGAYAVLRGRVEQLSAELAKANGELAWQLREKHALAARQTALLAALPAGVLVVDGGGVVREANEAAKAMLGADIAGMSGEELAQRFTRTECPLEWMLAGEPARRVSVQHRALEARGERIVLLHDVTEAHAARERFERGERLASMGEMAARVAHQLRTPLASAILYAGQLERTAMRDEERVQLGAKIVSRLRSLERVTREMLRYVRGEAAAPQPIEVGALLAEAAEVVRPVMAARGIAFVCQDESGGACLHGDRRGLAAALLSLLENAAQATGQGGRIELRAMANSRRVRIRVADSGIGIPADALPKLFEPFYSTRAEGTGLGLAIVKSVVEAHGGSVEVEAPDSTGASFTLVLPCVAHAGTAEPDRREAAAGASIDAGSVVKREAA
jgi:two-component system sensor histidine kinase FlrB